MLILSFSGYFYSLASQSARFTPDFFLIEICADREWLLSTKVVMVYYTYYILRGETEIWNSPFTSGIAGLSSLPGIRDVNQEGAQRRV